MKINLVLVTLLWTAALFCSCDEEGNKIFQVEIFDYLSGSRNIEMVSLPGGTYLMGSDLHPMIIAITFMGDTIWNIERPVHVVNLSPFAISNTEITQEQFYDVMGYNPSFQVAQAVDEPVENLTWYEAADFCNMLSQRLGFAPCYGGDYSCDFSQNGFRLPTEAEWEYAARGGVEQEYGFGDEAQLLKNYGWYLDNSNSRHSPVAQKKPNNFGLYDMHGNVSEFCEDYFWTYNCNAQNNPVDVESGVARLVRGGSWSSTADECRSAFRVAQWLDRHLSTIGFRVVRRD